MNHNHRFKSLRKMKYYVLFLFEVISMTVLNDQRCQMTVNINNENMFCCVPPTFQSSQMTLVVKYKVTWRFLHKCRRIRARVDVVCSS